MVEAEPSYEQPKVTPVYEEIKHFRVPEYNEFGRARAVTEPAFRRFVVSEDAEVSGYNRIDRRSERLPARLPPLPPELDI